MRRASWSSGRRSATTRRSSSRRRTGARQVHLVPHPEPVTLPRVLDVRDVVFKVGYPPDETQRIRVLLELGFDRDEPFAVDGVEVSPRRFAASYIGSRGIGPDERSANVKQVNVDGVRDGRPVTLVYDFAVEQVGRSASSAITGTVAAIAADLVAQGGEPGVVPAGGGVRPAGLRRCARGARAPRARERARSRLAPRTAGDTEPREVELLERRRLHGGPSHTHSRPRSQSATKAYRMIVPSGSAGSGRGRTRAPAPRRATPSSRIRSAGSGSAGSSGGGAAGARAGSALVARWRARRSRRVPDAGSGWCARRRRRTTSARVGRLLDHRDVPAREGRDRAVAAGPAGEARPSRRSPGSRASSTSRAANTRGMPSPSSAATSESTPNAPPYAFTPTTGTHAATVGDTTHGAPSAGRSTTTAQLPSSHVAHCSLCASSVPAGDATASDEQRSTGWPWNSSSSALTAKTSSNGTPAPSARPRT